MTTNAALAATETPDDPQPRFPTNVAWIEFAGERMACDTQGCLYWPQQSLLIVSDLHLEKGASLAARGRLVPPYDTGATLARLAKQIDGWGAKRVICLGDSFHAPQASVRMPDEYRRMLGRIMRGLDWAWICGNHDPQPPAVAGGATCDEIAIGAITLRHEPAAVISGAEICGHLHPSARIVRRGKTLRRRCFASDGRRIMLPSFGAYTGGLNVRDAAFDGLFDEAGLHAHLIGRERIYTIAGRDLI